MSVLDVNMGVRVSLAESRVPIPSRPAFMLTMTFGGIIRP